jgi:stage V sporulation protein B
MYLKKALRGTVIVLIISFIATITAYLFRMVLAKNLDISQYGLFFGLLSFFSLLIMFMDFGLSTAASKFIVEFNISKSFKDIKSLLLSILFFQIVTSIIIIAIIVLCIPQLSKNFFHMLNITIYIILMCVWFFTLPIITFFNAIFQGFQKYGLFSSIELARQVLGLIITVVLLFFGYGLISPFIAYALVNIICLGIYSPMLFKIFPQFFHTKFSFNKILLWKVFKFSLLLSISTLIGVIMTQTSTMMLTYFDGLAATGIYQVAIPIAGLTVFVFSILPNIAYPIISELNFVGKSQELLDGINFLYKYMYIITIPIAIILITFSGLIITLFFDAKFISAILPLRILIVMSIFSGIIIITTTIMSAIGRPQDIAKIMVYAAILNIVLNIVFIHLWSVTGAALATLISMFVAMIIALIRLRRMLNVSFPFRDWIIITIIGIALTFLLMFLDKIILLIFWIKVPILVGICGILYIGLLFLFRIISITEITGFIKVFLHKN